MIERRIYTIRDHRVMLDADLAELYQVETFNLNKAVKRNIDRFPDDFMFQLSADEWKALRFQIGIPNTGRGGRRFAPHTFTEQGVAMLSSVLNSERAVQVKIAIMRAFVKMREEMATHKDLAHKIEALERKYQSHDDEIQVIFKAIRQLLEAPPAPKRRIGFKPPNELGLSVNMSAPRRLRPGSRCQDRYLNAPAVFSPAAASPERHDLFPRGRLVA